MNDPVDDLLASGPTSPSMSDPVDALLAKGAESTAPASYSVTSQQAAGGLIRHAVTGLGSSAIAGARSIYDLATGVPLSEVDKRNQKFISEHTYQPQDPATAGLVKGFESNLNPMNWPTKAMDYMGNMINKVTGSTAAGPIASGIGQLALGAAPLIHGLSIPSGPDIPTSRGTSGWGPEEAVPTTNTGVTSAIAAPKSAIAVSAGVPEAQALEASGSTRPSYFEPQDVPGKPGMALDTEPVEGGVPKSATIERAAILRRVGLDTARDSAVEGNAKNAATDWQLSKFDEPAGVAAKAQFDTERDALQNHAQNIVRETGGTLGTDEDSLNQRGQTIAKPFDSLADWFDQRRRQLYQAADQRSGGHPVVQPLSLQELLDDPSFKNQLTARDQMHIRDGVAGELARFQQTNPQGLTVQNAEQFRQFLNSIWSPENGNVLGRMKGALDDDVMKGAGEDLYGPARQLAQLQHQVLDNPSGVAKLLERDPQTPINRTTPYVKIPDTIARLDPDQFNNVLRTLQTMPAEIQPEAQTAVAEIKAHLANKIYDAGSSTSGQWNARGVEKVVKANSAKLQSAFADQPETLAKIRDLRSAGNILAVNQSYPGAAAQAANALKRGFMSRALSRMGATAGAGAGSVLGPFGAAGGAALGEAAGGAAGAKLAENAAVKKWQSGVTKLTDTTTP